MTTSSLEWILNPVTQHFIGIKQSNANRIIYNKRNAKMVKFTVAQKKYRQKGEKKENSIISKLLTIQHRKYRIHKAVRAQMAAVPYIDSVRTENDVDPTGTEMGNWR